MSDESRERERERERGCPFFTTKFFVDCVCNPYERNGYSEAHHVKKTKDLAASDAKAEEADPGWCQCRGFCSSERLSTILTFFMLFFGVLGIPIAAFIHYTYPVPMYQGISNPLTFLSFGFGVQRASYTNQDAQKLVVPATLFVGAGLILSWYQTVRVGLALAYNPVGYQVTYSSIQNQWYSMQAFNFVTALFFSLLGTLIFVINLGVFGVYACHRSCRRGDPCFIDGVERTLIGKRPPKEEATPLAMDTDDADPENNDAVVFRDELRTRDYTRDFESCSTKDDACAGLCGCAPKSTKKHWAEQSTGNKRAILAMVIASWPAAVVLFAELIISYVSLAFPNGYVYYTFASADAFFAYIIGSNVVAVVALYEGDEDASLRYYGFPSIFIHDWLLGTYAFAVAIAAMALEMLAIGDNYGNYSFYESVWSHGITLPSETLTYQGTPPNASTFAQASYNAAWITYFKFPFYTVFVFFLNGANVVMCKNMSPQLKDEISRKRTCCCRCPRGTNSDE